jgi:hypothetical protein
MTDVHPKRPIEVPYTESLERACRATLVADGRIPC